MRLGDGEALLQVAPGRAVPPLPRCHGSQCVERDGLLDGAAGGARLPQCLDGERKGTILVALRVAEPSPSHEGAREEDAVDVSSSRERGFGARPAFLEMAANPPVPPEPTHEPQLCLGIASLGGVLDRCAEVVEIVVDQGPLSLVGAPYVALVHELDEVATVGELDGRALAAPVQEPAGVVTHGLEHRQARLLPRVHALEKARVDERFDLAGGRSRDDLRRLERAAAAEHREVRKRLPFRVAEQIRAPRECVGKRLLAGGRVTEDRFRVR